MIRARDLGNRSGILFGAGMPRLHALWGLTFGAVRGVFVHSPFALAWVIGAWVTVRRDFEWRRDLFLLAIPPAYFLATASLPDWEGGWNLGCRYITPSMPFIAEAVARATEDRRVRLFVAAATGWAVALHSLAMATWSMPPAGFGFRFPAMQLSWFLALHGAFSKMFPLLHGVRPNVLLALVGFLGALGIIAAVPHGERRRTAIAIAAALCVFAVVGVMSGRRLPGESYRFAMQVASYMGYGWSPRL